MSYQNQNQVGVWGGDCFFYPADADVGEGESQTMNPLGKNVAYTCFGKKSVNW